MNLNFYVHFHIEEFRLTEIRRRLRRIREMANLQQLSDDVEMLKSALAKSSTDEANFITSTVAPFNARLSAIETRLSALEDAVKAIKGA